MRPAIHGNALDIACRIEAAAGQRTSELVADLTLEGLERRREQLGTADFVLFALGQSVFRWRALRADQDRLVERYLSSR